MFKPQWTGVTTDLCLEMDLLQFNWHHWQPKLWGCVSSFRHYCDAPSHFLVRAHFDLTTHPSIPVLCLQCCSWNKAAGSSAEVTGFVDMHSRLVIYGWTAPLLCRSSVSSKAPPGWTSAPRAVTSIHTHVSNRGIIDSPRHRRSLWLFKQLWNPWVPNIWSWKSVIIVITYRYVTIAAIRV